MNSFRSHHTIYQRDNTQLSNKTIVTFGLDILKYLIIDYKANTKLLNKNKINKYSDEQLELRIKYKIQKTSN